MNDVIIACDFSNQEKLFEFLKPFEGLNPYLKLGMEIIYKEGPQLVTKLHDMGFKIFLDLKLHDIPNTVEKAMKNIAKLGVEITNVHAAGGIKMMEAARRGLDSTEEGKKTKLIAVTQLTSTSQEVLENELLIEKPLADVVKQYALNAKKAGLDGVVCSPLEAGLVQEACGSDFVTVTPGIRFADDSKGDQKRVTTPAKAREIGSHYIVVGRSITGAADPVAAYRRCVAEFVKGE